MAPDACRPFSIDRKGLVLGEGAAMLVLEPLEQARARGAQILGRDRRLRHERGCRRSHRADLGGMTRAMDGALADAKLAPQDIQYINAHGTGTAANDAAETQALHRVFGAHAGKLAVSSTKSMVGHALGAAGALEMVADLASARERIVPPTIGYLGPDPACDLDYVPNEARAHDDRRRAVEFVRLRRAQRCAGGEEVFVNGGLRRARLALGLQPLVEIGR